MNRRLQQSALAGVVAVTISAASAFAATTKAGDPAVTAAALATSLRSGNTAEAKRLLDRGANANAKDEQGIPAIMLAALYGDARTVRLLLEHGADPNARNPEGATALIWSAGDIEKAQALIATGADVKVQSALGRTALHTAASRDGNLETVKMLVERGADVNAADRVPNFSTGGVGTTPLMVAAMGRDSRTLIYLVEHGAKVDSKDSAGGTALHAAARNGSIENVRYLLSKGVDPNVAIAEFPFKGFTPLALAASLEHQDVVEALLAAGANVNVKDGLGYTPLTWAAMSERNRDRAVRALLNAGADRNVKGAFDETPSTWAARRGDTPIARLLGVEPNAAAASPSALKASMEAHDRTELRASVERSLPLLLESGPKFVKVSACVSCHNNTLPLMAVKLARDRNIPVTIANEDKQIKMIKGMLLPAVEPMREATATLPDAPVSGGYILQALSVQGYAPDAMTTALVQNIAAQQLADGRWPNFAPRAPIENGEIQATALGLRSLQLYGPAGRKAEFERQVAKAREWLLHSEPQTTEDATMKLWGLYWSGASSADVQSAARPIVGQQRADGGWAQLETLSSDAYATGKVLSALYETGALRPADEAYRRGVSYLLSTQLSDGTWAVKARAFPFQPLKESGFPHGRDQWISSAATAWASMALSYATDSTAAAVALR